MPVPKTACDWRTEFLACLQVYRCTYRDPADNKEKDVVLKSIDLPHSAVDNSVQAGTHLLCMHVASVREGDGHVLLPKAESGPTSIEVHVLRAFTCQCSHHAA